MPGVDIHRPKIDVPSLDIHGPNLTKLILYSNINYFNFFYFLLFYKNVLFFFYKFYNIYCYLIISKTNCIIFLKNI